MKTWVNKSGGELDVDGTSGGIFFSAQLNGSWATTYLPFSESMQVAAEIVRIVHGERKPRVWDAADDVPDGVIVKFSCDAQAVRYGEIWLYGDLYGEPGIYWEKWDYAVHFPADYSPFTEVLR